MAAPRIALAHDWLVGLRGGEHVVDRLARLYGPTDLYTLVNDGRPLTEAIDACRVVTSPLQRLPGAAGRLRRYYLPLMPWAVERIRVGPCDLLLSSSTSVMKSIRPPAGVPHLCYCNTPARYIWEQGADYTTGSGGTVRRLGLGAIRERFKRWDRETAAGVTHFIGNSRHTASRIQRCFGREAEVIHPPVRTELFTVDPRVEREPWLLVVSALEPYKRVDLAVDAANRAGLPIRIAGTGSQRRALERRAGSSVELLGRVSDKELIGLFRRARALVHPQVEDFGITAVEAQATGCPVVALAAGGSLDTVTDETGVFFDEQTPEALLDAIDRLMPRSIDAGACRRNAERFCERRFDDEIARCVDRLLATSPE